MGTPPSQLGGLGERCKLPQRGLGRSPSRQRFFIISCSNHYIKLHAKTEIVQSRASRHARLRDIKIMTYLLKWVVN